jgi:Domain of unknown function (DUF4124)
MKYLLAFLLLLAVDTYAEIYKCVYRNGRESFSDRHCPNGTRQIALSQNKMHWTKVLRLRKPEHTKVIDIVKEGKNTLVSFGFSDQQEMEAFMRLTRQLSGQPVTVIKVDLPEGGMYGQALLRVGRDIPPNSTPPK